jgi:hypothetical protein
MPYQDGIGITGAFTFAVTPRGSTSPVTLVMQTHNYKDGGVKKQEFAVGSKMVAQPMQTGIGTHEVESLIPAATASEYRGLLYAGQIVDTANFPNWNSAAGPHFVESVEFSDKVDDKSTMKIVISESNGGVAAATE